MTLPEFLVAEQEGSVAGREGLPKSDCGRITFHTGDCRSRRPDVASVAAPVEIFDPNGSTDRGSGSRRSLRATIAGLPIPLPDLLVMPALRQ